MTSTILNDIKADLIKIENAFKSAEAEFEAYVKAKGGISVVISEMESKIASTVSTLVSLSSIIGVPAADITLIQKAFAAIQGVESTVAKIQTVLAVAPVLVSTASGAVAPTVSAPVITAPATTTPA